jgi:hypothetical protein
VGDTLTTNLMIKNRQSSGKILASLASLFALNRMVPTAESRAVHAGSVRAYSATIRHSPTPSLGHSGVGSTQEAAIQFATLTVASSAFAAVGPSTIERPV